MEGIDKRRVGRLTPFGAWALMEPELLETDLLVLQKQPYGEHDMVVHTLSSEYGKLLLFVRGGNGGVRRKFPEIELFRLLHVGIKSGRGDFMYPVFVEQLRDFGGVAGKFERYQAAAWICKFAMLNVVEQLPSPFFTNAVEVAFQRLCSSDLPSSAILTGVSLAFVFEAGWLAHAIQTREAVEQCRQLLEMASGKEAPLLSEVSWKQQFDWCCQLLLINECKLPE